MRAPLILAVLLTIVLLVSSCSLLRNSPPYAPYDPNPPDDSVGIDLNPKLSWKCSDPDGDYLYYDVYFGTTQNPTRVAHNITKREYDPGKLDYGTVYYWKIVAKDTRGNKTEGPLWKFRTNMIPSIPENPEPADGAVGIPLETTLKWEATDPDDDELEYDLFFGNTNPPPKKAENLTSPSYHLSSLEKGTTYYWRVVAKDDKGAIASGPVWSFRTNLDPNPPQLISPANGETDVSTRVTLVWECSDPDDDELVYDVFLGESEDELELQESDVEGTSYTLNLQEGKTYYWKVVAKDGKGGTSESPVFRFTTLRLFRIEWQRVLGGMNIDKGRAVEKLSDGGYVVVGETSSDDGDVNELNGATDYWVVKLDPGGDILWKRTFGGTGEDVAFGVRETATGEYAVLGYTLSNDVDVDFNHGGKDVWLVLITPTGYFQWGRTFGGSGNDISADSPNSILLINGGFNGAIVLAQTDSNDGDVTSNLGERDGWMIQLDENLQAVERQRILGGNKDDHLVSMHRTSDGGYIMVGYSDSTTGDFLGNKGGYDLWVVKLDRDLNVEWSETYGGSADDKGYDVVEAPDGGFLVVGCTLSSDGDVEENKGGSDLWVLKLDSEGNLRWEKTFGGSSSDCGRIVKNLSNGRFLILGSTSSSDGDVSRNHGKTDVWILKIDENGNLKWDQTFGGSDIDEAYGMVQTSDGGFVVVGYTCSEDGDLSDQIFHGFSDLWVFKLK